MRDDEYKYKELENENKNKTRKTKIRKRAGNQKGQTKESGEKQ